MNHSTRLIPVLAAVGLVSSASPTPRTPDPPRGSLVIVGGGDRSETMMHRFVELAGGRGAPIAVVPNASSEPEETGRALGAEVDSLGARSGDSGSPVFQITSGNDARLVGVLWGGSGSQSFVFSPLNQVEQELGGLATF